jgi:hypothetical protein
MPANINLIPLDNLVNAPLGIASLLTDPEAHNFYINEISACGDASVAKVIGDNVQDFVAILRGLQKTFPALAGLIDVIIGLFGVTGPSAQRIEQDVGQN